MVIQFYINLVSIILVGVIVTTLTIYLYSQNKKLKKEIKEIKKEKNRFKKELKKIKPNIKNISKFNKLIRDFFKEEYKINYNIPYLELAKSFKKKKKPKLAELCELISEINYSGKIKNKQINKLKNLSIKIMQ